MTTFTSNNRRSEVAGEEIHDWQK